MPSTRVQSVHGAVDVGIAASYFGVSMTAPVITVHGASQEQRQRWLTEIIRS